MKMMVGLLIMALALCAGGAFAGDYHMGATLICADCHTMHYSAQHGYDGGAPPTLGPTGPNEWLLKGEGNALCLMCHDGQSTAPDVLGANTGTHIRQAGGLNEVGFTGEYAEYKGHTLDSTAQAPGGTWSAATHGLECVSCHAQHGQTSGVTYPAGYTNGQYRNLKTKPGGISTGVQLKYAKTTQDLALDIFETDPTLGQVPTHYATANVDFNEPVQTASAMASWCKGCHTDFHGTTGGAEVGGTSGGDLMDGTTAGWHRHPNADVNIGHVASKPYISSLAQFQSHPNRVKVMSNTGNWATGTDVTPSCFSCHKSHGNKNAFGLIYMSGTGTVSEEGDTGGNQDVKGMCRQCHVQGA